MKTVNSHPFLFYYTKLHFSWKNSDVNQIQNIPLMILEGNCFANDNPFQVFQVDRSYKVVKHNALAEY